MELRIWFVKMLNELDDGSVDPEAIEKLRGMIADAFAQWHVETGYGSAATGTDPN